MNHRSMLSEKTTPKQSSQSGTRTGLKVRVKAEIQRKTETWRTIAQDNFLKNNGIKVWLLGSGT